MTNSETQEFLKKQNKTKHEKLSMKKVDAWTHI